jgi:hypothetical protein
MTEKDYVLGTLDEEIACLGLQHRVWMTTWMVIKVIAERQ